MKTNASNITQLLQDYASGQSEAFQKLWPEVYAELRKMAARRIKSENRDHTLQPTALVNEAYLKLVQGSNVKFADRSHFFAIAANVMRRILIDYAKAKKADKRGGGAFKVTFAEDMNLSSEPESLDVIKLDEALEVLSKQNERAAKVVELRYFGGLNFQEIGIALNVSEPTVKRDWKLAKTWLFRELKSKE